jgi:CRP/FNR family cyclic AMP-dependent transcriptional regulator
MNMVLSEKDKQQIKMFLRKVFIFRNFSDSNLKQVINNFRTISVKKGEDIVFRSDEGTDLYIVLKGKVKVSLVGAEGNEFVLTTFNEGDFFGEMSLIDGRSRSANVIAEEDAFIGVLRRDGFLNTVKHTPAIAFDLLVALVERLRKADDMIETLAFLDVHERVVRFLVQDAKKNGEIDRRGFYKIKKRTHQDIASNIGSSREAVSKILKVLIHKHAIIEQEKYFLLPSRTYKEIITTLNL